MDTIKMLKELFEEGFMDKEEYNDRRLQVINTMCSLMLCPSSMPKASVLAEADGSQLDSLPQNGHA